MPVYEYTAKNNKGIKIKGNVEAGDILAARQVIYQKKTVFIKYKNKTHQ